MLSARSIVREEDLARLGMEAEANGLSLFVSFRLIGKGGKRDLGLDLSAFFSFIAGKHVRSVEECRFSFSLQCAERGGEVENEDVAVSKGICRKEPCRGIEGDVLPVQRKGGRIRPRGQADCDGGARPSAFMYREGVFPFRRIVERLCLCAIEIDLPRLIEEEKISAFGF